jgi:UDP-N-acetylmuramate: L-alanyl-gamma-D-glutamyl-meso-diaminopimelate ligase
MTGEEAHSNKVQIATQQIYILGIAGTFMASMAVLAKELGFRVSGVDAAIYPPMSDLLRQANIEVDLGYDTPVAIQNMHQADVVVIGNALSRGNPCVEAVLSGRQRFYSGPAWLAEYVLRDRWVLAVSGTHGKTTTTSLLAFILDQADLSPGFLIGGLCRDFPVSSRLGQGTHFVIEADEYDSAFFDKRPKCLHYFPKTLILNNIEYDHADIYPNLEAIERQFGYLLRTIPKEGKVIYPQSERVVRRVLQQGCWSTQTAIGLCDSLADVSAFDLSAIEETPDGRCFTVYQREQRLGSVEWSLLGKHNISNALVAVAAAVDAGVDPVRAVEALSLFQGVARRLEHKGTVNGVTVYDDFAHHPTAIGTTLSGLRAHRAEGRLLVVVDFKSYTMRNGIHGEALIDALVKADEVFLFQGEYVQWDCNAIAQKLAQPSAVLHDTRILCAQLVAAARPGDAIVIMSNGGFNQMIAELLFALQNKRK